MACAIVDNIIYVALVWLSEGGKCSFVVRMTFWGTNIVAPVDVTHPRTLFRAYPFFFFGRFESFFEFLRILVQKLRIPDNVSVISGLSSVESGTKATYKSVWPKW